MVTEGRHLLEIRRQTRIETGPLTADLQCLTRCGLDTDLAANFQRMRVICELPDFAVEAPPSPTRPTLVTDTKINLTEHSG